MKRFNYVVMFVVIMAAAAGTWISASSGKVKTIHISEKNITNIRETLADAYLRIPVGFESDKKGFFYFLDRDFNTLTKVDRNTLKIVKTISKKGDGAFENQTPDSLRVKNGKIYAFDFYFSGIRIFDLDGKPIKEFSFDFKTYKNLGLNARETLGKYNKLDVSSKGEIYIRFYDPDTKTTLQVLDENGKLLRSMIPITPDYIREYVDWTAGNTFSFNLDANDNVWVLYPKEGKLKKFSPEGNLVLEHDLLKDDIEDKDKITSESPLFSEFELIDGNRIMVHAGKGFYVYNEPDMKLAAKILAPEGVLNWGKFVFEEGKIWTIKGMATVPGYK